MRALTKNGKRVGRPPLLLYLTPDEVKERKRQQQCEASARYLSNLSPEQKARRKQADAAYKKRRAKTDDLKARNREAVRKSRAKRKAEMSPEELEAERAKTRARNRAYVLSDEQRQRQRELAKQWYEKNADRKKELRAKWAESNPDAYRIYAQNRRARKRAQNGAVSLDIVERLMRLQRGACAGCRAVLGARVQAELDHIVPLAAGGAHDDLNLQLLCRRCNRSKGTKDPVRFMQERGLLL